MRNAMSAAPRVAMGATYETTPDGREGWATYFARNKSLDRGPHGTSGTNSPSSAAPVLQRSDPSLCAPVFLVHSHTLLWGVGTKTNAECIRSGGVWEAESNIELLDLVATPAATNWDMPFTVERINF
jgi:hypothetical protein